MALFQSLCQGSYNYWSPRRRMKQCERFWAGHRVEAGTALSWDFVGSGARPGSAGALLPRAPVARPHGRRELNGPLW